MKGDQWKKRFQELLGRDKPVKLVVLLGICGIVLIGLSSLWEPGQKTGSVPSSAAESQTYGWQLETDLARIVTAITGEEAPTVVVTLADNGRSLYASDERESGRQEETASTTERESSHILVEDADGNQHALTITQTHPEVQGAGEELPGRAPGVGGPQAFQVGEDLGLLHGLQQVQGHL